MASTYTAGLTDKDRVRTHLADNVAGKMILTDEEIIDLLNSYGFVEGSAKSAEAIAAYYFRLATEWKEDDVSEDYSLRAKGYMEIAAETRKSGQAPNGGGPRRGAVLSMTSPDLTNYRS